ncbi:hypothetical protein WMY93_012091 [Mugilogobius chulae]|uniref:Uncharacterized protein n=1 Tax=Mugilogobius chulae TaxID=88201 RepID=A0AAW0P4R6_9GOBI
MEMMMSLTTDEPIQLHTPHGRWPQASLKLRSSEGSRDIPVSLREDLQDRLHKEEWFGQWMKEDWFKSFLSSDAVSINGNGNGKGNGKGNGYDAKLLLTVEKTGKACFLLFLREGSRLLKNEFYKSWVGLYKSNRENNKNYLKEPTGAYPSFFGP